MTNKRPLKGIGMRTVNAVKEPVEPSKEKQQLPALGALDQVGKITALEKNKPNY